ncbi:hypothetical protein V6N13_028590 [Hibiscus sabdariffa]|uniref:Uncharacterized protein n=2 Tax=Hibiscus sabdariffa TaxID=183260 RepID=A0ABR2P9K1_9ROSI
MGKQRGDASFLFVLVVVVVSLHPFISVASAIHLRDIYCPPEIGYRRRLPPCKERPEHTPKPIPRSPQPPEHVYSPPPPIELPPPPPTPKLSPPPPSIPRVPPPPRRHRPPPECPPQEPDCDDRRHRGGCQPCGVNDDGHPYCPP